MSNRLSRLVGKETMIPSRPPTNNTANRDNHSRFNNNHNRMNKFLVRESSRRTSGNHHNNHPRFRTNQIRINQPSVLVITTTSRMVKIKREIFPTRIKERLLIEMLKTSNNNNSLRRHHTLRINNMT